MAFNIFAPQKQQNNPNEQPQAVQQQQVTQQVMQPVALPSQPQPTPVAKPQTTLPAIDPNSDTAGMDALSSMVTTPQEEERMRKASVANRRIMAVADALRHIGNIYNTVNYAPAQQFNNPVVEEQQRYEKGKALRDAANVKYYTYQQAKAAQDAKARQWQADFNLKVANAAAQAQHRRDQLKEQGRYHDLNIALGQGRLAEQKRSNEARQKETERNNRARLGLGYATLNETRRYHNERLKQGEGGGRNNTVTLRGKNGWYSKKMNNEEATAFYNQTYDEMKKRGLIDEQSVLSGLPADVFGQKTISLAAKKAAVDNALLYQDETGDWLASQYEFEFDPRYVNGTPMNPQQYRPFSDEMGAGVGNIGGAVTDWSQYMSNPQPAKKKEGGKSDWSQYLVK